MIYQGIEKAKALFYRQCQWRCRKAVLSPNCSARIKEFDFYSKSLISRAVAASATRLPYPIKAVKFRSWRIHLAGKTSGTTTWSPFQYRGKGRIPGNLRYRRPDTGVYRWILRSPTRTYPKLDPEKVIFIQKLIRRRSSARYMPISKPKQPWPNGSRSKPPR